MAIPKVIWLAPKKAELRWPVFGPVCAVLFVIQCGIRVFLAIQQKGDADRIMAVLFIESVTDPLLYVWGILAAVGFNETTALPLRCKCPHCGDEWEPSENLKKAALGSEFRCTECKNTFLKKTVPP
jgi:hypothetical protein